MAFFEHHSWHPIAKLEIYSGLWPYQAWFKNYLIRVMFVLLMVSGCIPVVVRLQKEWGVNLAIATENTFGIELFIGIATKILVLWIFEKNRQKIYDKVNDQFRTITDPHEAFVLGKSAEHSLKFCIKYLILHGVVFVIFGCLPVGKMCFKYLMNNNELEKLFPFYVDYDFFIDEDKYYSLILLHIFAICVFYAGMNCAYDFPFIMNVRHVCSIFQIVKIRLQEASGFLEEFEWNMLDFSTADNQAYDIVTKAIDLHKEAFEIVSLIEDVYNYSLFVILLESLLMFSGGVYLILLNRNRPFDLLRYFVFFIGLFVHFVVQFVHGQMIIDSSSLVFDACCNVKWYFASTKTRKLLSIMMFRSSRPSVLTGAGFFTVSMEIFGKMIKAGFSYLSIFTSRMRS